MKNIKNNLLLLVTFISLFTITSCKEEEKYYMPEATVTPAIAFPGELLTITGINLSGIKKVTFNGVVADFNPTLNTDENFLLRVPSNAPFGAVKITLYNGGGDATMAAFDFTVKQPKPTILRFEPESANVGETITIEGVAFIDVSSVKIGTVECEITSRSVTKLTIKVPADATGGPISITTKGGVGESTKTFAAETVLSYISNFDGSGLRNDGKNWYVYGDIDESEDSGGAKVVTLDAKTPAAFSGKFLQITNSGVSNKGYNGSSTWDWDNWKGFGMEASINDKAIRFDINNGGKMDTEIFIAFDDKEGGGNYNYNLKLDFVGWKSITIPLNKFKYWYGTDIPLEASKINRFIMGFNPQPGKKMELNIDNIRFVKN